MESMEEGGGKVEDEYPPECRICRIEEDDVRKLETPCSCAGSVQFAHRTCIQMWCNHKGDTICEMCLQTFKGGYEVLPSPSKDVVLGFSWAQTAWGPMIGPNPVDLELEEEERSRLALLDEEEAVAQASFITLCHSIGSAALIVILTIFFLRLAMMTVVAGVNDIPTLFTRFILRAVAISVSTYCIGSKFKVLQRFQFWKQSKQQQKTQIAVDFEQASPVLA